MSGVWPTKPLGDVTANFDSLRVPLSSRERGERRGPYPYYWATGIMDYVDDFLFEGRYLLIAEDGSVERDDGTLDDKIELNRRMSETLEAMARALFKSWFVDFDPMRAKAEGRDPGLPQPLADLFPAHLVDSELGEIPERWKVGCFGDELAASQNPPKGHEIKYAFTLLKKKVPA